MLDATGAVLHRFLHGPAIDQVFADEDSVNGLLWDLGDNQNTTRDVINNSGTVVNHLTYSPFGVIASESDASKTPFAAYTGRDWDEDLQLQYNRGRWYEPASGRWLSEDPIRFSAGDTNLQRYVGNAPTNYIDPEGLAKLTQRQQKVLDSAAKELERLINTGTISRDEAGFRFFIIRNALEQRLAFEEAPPAGPGAYRNPKFWTDYGDPNREFTVRRADKNGTPIRPRDAIKDIWTHDRPTTTGCRKATDLIVIKSYIDLLEWKFKNDPKELERHLNAMDRYIGYDEAPKSGELYGDRLEATPKQERNGGFPDSAFRPGDNVTFDNPFYGEYGGHGLQGSNVFYAGNGVFIGYDGTIWPNREKIQMHMQPWVLPKRTKPTDFPAATVNRPGLPKARERN